MNPKPPVPDRAEAVALFRLGVIGDLLARDLTPGELRDELVARAAVRYRPPGASSSRTYHWKTLQAWFYAARRRGHLALKPASRKTGFAAALEPHTRELLLQIRREHPSAAAGLILDTAVHQGIVQKGQISVDTLRRLLAAAGLSRVSLTREQRRDRRRWESGHVGALWHADVMHLWVRPLQGPPRKLYVHALLDDHSRYVLALEARLSEQEVDLLSIFVGALLRWPAPHAFYVDNGACYRGDTLALAAARLDVRLIHATPRDPRARGKMERFWRTLRQLCTDHLAAGVSLQDVNAALLAFLDAKYHPRPHAGLMGETPSKRFHAGLQGFPRTARQLAEALQVTVPRKIAGDGTFSVDGRLFEVRGRHLHGKRVQVLMDPLTGALLDVRHDEKPVPFGPCDPAVNRHRRRAEPSEAPAPTLPFDPIAALLAAARKETP